MGVEGAERDITLMKGEGLQGGFARYAAISIIAVVLHGFLGIFNLSVMGHVEDDSYAANRFCILLFLVGAFVTIGIAALLSTLQA